MARLRRWPERLGTENQRHGCTPERSRTYGYTVDFPQLCASGHTGCEQLAQALRAEGSTVWRDQDSLRGGQHWPQVIGEAIDTHDLFLLVWSQHAARSHFVEMEWNIAVASGKPLLPWALDETPLPAALRATHAVQSSPGRWLPRSPTSRGCYVSSGAARHQLMPPTALRPMGACVRLSRLACGSRRRTS